MLSLKGGDITIKFTLKNPFRKKEPPNLSKPNAIAFVDYEHWYISLDKLYHIKPDIKAWRNELLQKYEMKEIIFFADFSNNTIKYEIPKIREVSNVIIETQNTSNHYKKDFTDFIMLDHIYQKAMTATNIDTFIIFSGDGHFSSVISFLINQCTKHVGIYGIKEAVSNQLKNSANWFVELPNEEDNLNRYYNMILRNLKYIEDASHTRPLKATFWATVEAVSRYNNVDKNLISDMLRQMIEKGYVYQTHERVAFTKNIKVLNADWALLTKDGIWTG